MVAVGQDFLLLRGPYSFSGDCAIDWAPNVAGVGVRERSDNGIRRQGR